MLTELSHVFGAPTSLTTEIFIENKFCQDTVLCIQNTYYVWSMNKTASFASLFIHLFD
jgi:hypothetical protein